MPTSTLPSGFCKARLRFELGKFGFTETYLMGSGSPISFLPALNCLCRLRSMWLATGVQIVFASVSDLGSPRDGVAADLLPYNAPNVTYNSAGPVGSIDIGYRYRFELTRTTGQPGASNMRIFRGIPDVGYIRNEALYNVTDWPTVATGADNLAGSSLIYDPAGSAFFPNQATCPGTAGNAPGGGLSDGLSLAGWRLYGASLIPFLVQKTCYMYYSTPALQWLAVPWTNSWYRGLGERRCGRVFDAPKGRYYP